jgi:hypothetical protein
MLLLKRNGEQKMSVMTLAQLKRAVDSGVNMENAAREVVRYGQIVKNAEWQDTNENSRYAGFHRVRTIAYFGLEWRHVMHNGNLVSLGWKKV